MFYRLGIPTPSFLIPEHISCSIHMYNYFNLSTLTKLHNDGRKIHHNQTPTTQNDTKLIIIKFPQ